MAMAAPIPIPAFAPVERLGDDDEVEGLPVLLMLAVGEKEEEVEELRGDVGELKRIYRELVESKVGGGGGRG